MVALGGRGMCGFPGGACVVALSNNARGCKCMVAPGGACLVALGGIGCMHGCSGGGHAWLLLAWLPRRGCSGGACVRGIRRDTEIRSMSGRYASYWNAFLLYSVF